MSDFVLPYHKLCQKYQGVLWGEHGKGVRSEYSEEYFGRVYQAIRAIKTIFDPYNQMNPGKIAVPLSSKAILYAVAGTPMRGKYDALINKNYWNKYKTINYCNGNGACFNYDVNSPMCPSYKATGDRRQSPKGRAVILKEWQKRKSQGETINAIEEEAFEILKTCLSCGSCTSGCPIKVDIPDARSKFMETYYKKRKRPLLDYLLASAESLAPIMYALRHFINPVLKTSIIKNILKNVGLVDIMLCKTNTLSMLIKNKKVILLNDREVDNLLKYKELINKKSVILIPDALSTFYDDNVLKSIIELLSILGLNVYLAPYKNSGKTFQVLGMRRKFLQVAQRQAQLLEKLTLLELPILGVEPPITLMYRKDYKEMFGAKINIRLIQEFLYDYLDLKNNIEHAKSILGDHEYYLLSHCMEKMVLPESDKLWQDIFEYLGLTLKIIPTGCCGMSGSFGHLTEQKELSKNIYENSWKTQIDDLNPHNILATGFSCRSQVERFSSIAIQHPAVIINRYLQAQ